MIGALAFIAMSWSFVIFSAWVSDSEPPNTVKSLANTKVLRPLTVPQPVTTPSPGTLVFSMPNSVERCSTNMSNSSNDPLSSRSSTRSRAVSLPRACCASIRFFPPPSFAPARRSSRASRICFIDLYPRSQKTGLGTSNTAISQAETAFPPHLAIQRHRPRRACDDDDRNRSRRQRDRRGQAHAAAGGPHFVCSHDALVCALGRFVVVVRPSVSGTGLQLHRLSGRPQDRRVGLQCRAQHRGAGGVDVCGPFL